MGEAALQLDPQEQQQAARDLPKAKRQGAQGNVVQGPWAGSEAPEDQKKEEKGTIPERVADKGAAVAQAGGTAVKTGGQAVRGAAKTGQAAAKGVEMGAKGVEMGAKGGEMAMKGGQAAMKGMQAGAQAMGAASKGLSSAGSAIQEAGAGLDATGVGAIAGVPLNILGGVMQVGGGAGQVASKGVELGAKAGEMGFKAGEKGFQAVGKGAKGVQKGAKAAQKGLGKVDQIGKKMTDLGGRVKDKAQDFRQQLKRLQELKKKAKALTSPVRQTAKQAWEAVKNPQILTAQLLKWSWFAVLFTPLTGMDAIGGMYINLHFIMYYMGGPLGHYFCQPGSEWQMGTDVAALAGKQSSSVMQSIKSSVSAQALKIAETGGWLMMDLIFLVGLFIIFSIMWPIATCEGRKALGDALAGIYGWLVSLSASIPWNCINI